MHSHAFSRALVLFASAATLLLPGVASSKNGRDFMAYYRIHEVSQSGNAVLVNIQLKLFNYSGRDVTQGTVAVYDTQPMRTALGGFKPVKLIRTRGEANLSQEFSVSRTEYERWQQGANPVLLLLFKDSSGHALQRPIELIRRPLPPIEPAQ